MQVVESMEETLMGLFLAAEELDIVYQQHLDAAVPASEIFRGSVANGGDELVGELLGGHIEHRHAAGGAGLADGLQEMGLAQPGGRV